MPTPSTRYHQQVQPAPGVLGRGQAGVFRELTSLVHNRPFKPWGLHSDNGQKFLNDQLVRFTRQEGLQFHRSYPYKKNDNAHIEQKNRQLVPDIVAYGRLDTLAQVDWLNQVYACLDPLCQLLPAHAKVIAKQRCGSQVRKGYDRAYTPFQRLLNAHQLPPEAHQRLLQHVRSINPLDLKRRWDALLHAGAESLTEGLLSAEQFTTSIFH